MTPCQESTVQLHFTFHPKSLRANPRSLLLNATGPDGERYRFHIVDAGAITKESTFRLHASEDCRALVVGWLDSETFLGLLKVILANKGAYELSVLVPV